MNMLRSLFLVWILFQNAAASSVQVRVADAAGQPLPDVRVRLDLYEPGSVPERMEVWTVFSGHCRTDQNGECTIVIGETHGLLRGRLDLGSYGGRDVIWPGGALEAPVLVDLENMRVKGTEAGPYDLQEKDGGIAIRQGIPWGLILVVTLSAGGILVRVYLRSKREHA